MEFKNLTIGWNGGKTGPTCPSDTPTVAGEKWGFRLVGYGVETVAIVVQQDCDNGDDLMDDYARLFSVSPQLYELAKAVAHIGIDFGYGNFELSEDHIQKAREIVTVIEGNHAN